jgi:hypothetical protein
MGPIFVERTPVAWAKEKLGLFKPADRAAQVSAVDREHFKVLFRVTFNPAGYMSGLGIWRYSGGIFKCDHPSRTNCKLVDRTERDPGRPISLDDGRDEEAYDRNTDHRASDDIESQPELEQKIPAGRPPIKLRIVVRTVGRVWIFRGHKLRIGTGSRTSACTWLNIGSVAMRDQPSNDISDVLVRHWLVWHQIPVIRHAQILSAGNRHAA